MTISDLTISDLMNTAVAGSTISPRFPASTFGASSAAARLGGMAAPSVVLLAEVGGAGLPLVVFGGAAALATLAPIASGSAAAEPAGQPSTVALYKQPRNSQ